MSSSDVGIALPGLETLTPAAPPPMERTALLSPCSTYRYLLGRWWGSGSHVAFVMLNPSTADAERDDPTIRRCIGYARAWGYSGLVVANLYAYRATCPADLWRAEDPIGPENDDHLYEAAMGAEEVVCAWGALAPRARAETVEDLLLGRGEILSGREVLKALRLLKDGSPAHPLYLPASLAPVVYAEKCPR